MVIMSGADDSCKEIKTQHFSNMVKSINLQNQLNKLK